MKKGKEERLVLLQDGQAGLTERVGHEKCGGLYLQDYRLERRREKNYPHVA